MTNKTRHLARMDIRELKSLYVDQCVALAKYHELYGPLPSTEHTFSRPKRKRTMSPRALEQLAKARASTTYDPITRRYVRKSMDTVSTD